MLLGICRPLKSISRQQFMEQIGAQTERIMENWNRENSEGFKESYTINFWTNTDAVALVGILHSASLCEIFQRAGFANEMLLLPTKCELALIYTTWNYSNCLLPGNLKLCALMISFFGSTGDSEGWSISDCIVVVTCKINFCLQPQTRWHDLNILFWQLFTCVLLILT